MGGKASTLETLNKKSSSEDVAKLLGSNAKGKFVIVTGGGGGLGYETSRILCKYGANVTISCRTREQGDNVIKKIKEELGQSAEISYITMDLQDLETVKTFAAEYEKSKKPLNLLINNAGVMACDLSKTKQSFEMQFGVNHIGHFALTKLLLPILSSSGQPNSKSKVVNLSSLGNWLYGPPTAIMWDDLNGDLSYDKWERYGQSKLANILFSNELNRQCVEKKSNVISVAVHPGVILETGLARHNSLFAMVLDNIAHHWRSPVKLFAILSPYMKNIPQGSATTLRAALDPDIAPGKWYCDCQETTSYLHPLAFDDATARSLWQVSEAAIAPFM